MFLKLINWMNTIHMIKKLDVHLYLSKNIELLLTQTLNNVISGECLIVMSMELNYCITDWTALQQRYQKISSVQNQSDDFMQNIFKRFINMDSKNVKTKKPGHKLDKKNTKIIKKN